MGVGCICSHYSGNTAWLGMKAEVNGQRERNTVEDKKRYIARFITNNQNLPAGINGNREEDG